MVHVGIGEPASTCCTWRDAYNDMVCNASQCGHTEVCRCLGDCSVSDGSIRGTGDNSSRKADSVDTVSSNKVVVGLWFKPQLSIRALIVQGLEVEYVSASTEDFVCQICFSASGLGILCNNTKDQHRFHNICLKVAIPKPITWIENAIAIVSIFSTSTILTTKLRSCEKVVCA